jgi:hypothetical protein
MTRLADAQNTTHELMAVSGHKTLAEVERYTKAFNKRKLADDGAAKRMAQSGNGQVTNFPARSYNPLSNSTH